MQYTVSLHRGTEKDYVREHNNRSRDLGALEAHIDRSRKHENWKDQSARAAYQEIFGEAVRERNIKIAERVNLSRAEKAKRMSVDYYEDVLRDKKKSTVYETIVTIGSRDERPSDEVCREILKAYSDGWEERNPNMKLIGSYYHEDELGAPHLHLDYIPVGEYESGQRLRNSQAKALEAMGYKQKTVERDGEFASALTQWQRDERKVISELMLERGLGTKKLKDKTAHKTVAEFKGEKIEESLKQLNPSKNPVLQKIQNTPDTGSITLTGDDVKAVKQMQTIVTDIEKGPSALNKFLGARAIKVENMVAKKVAEGIAERINQGIEIAKKNDMALSRKEESLNKLAEEVASYAQAEGRDAIERLLSEARKELKAFEKSAALGEAYLELKGEYNLPVEFEVAMNSMAEKTVEHGSDLWDRYVTIDSEELESVGERVEEQVRSREIDFEMER